MAIAAAARSIFRSSAGRTAATRLASQSKSARSVPFSTRTPLLTNRIFRSPAELSACLESLQPYHTATASALMTSMLTVSRCGFSWLSEVPFVELCFAGSPLLSPALARVGEATKEH